MMAAWMVFCAAYMSDGEVTVVFDTLHAITMTTEQGAELLIHIGLDTVTLKGTPFTAHVAAGDHVKKGDLLLDADLEKIHLGVVLFLLLRVFIQGMMY